MTPEQVTAMLSAVTALVAALTGFAIAIRRVDGRVKATSERINGRMDELLTVAQLAARKQGELEGRDFMAPPVVTSSSSPSPREIPPRGSQNVPPEAQH